MGAPPPTPSIDGPGQVRRREGRRARSHLRPPARAWIYALRNHGKLLRGTARRSSLGCGGSSILGDGVCVCVCARERGTWRSFMIVMEDLFFYESYDMA